MHTHTGWGLKPSQEGEEVASCHPEPPKKGRRELPKTAVKAPGAPVPARPQLLGLWLKLVALSNCLLLFFWL